MEEVRCSDAEYEKRKRIFETIKGFTRTEQEEVYRILKRNTEEVSSNRNGMFFDLVMLKQKTIDEIVEWIEFCSKNSKLFQERDVELEKLKETNDGKQ
jgi:hypothetical protein